MEHEHSPTPYLILASKSPRRQYLLSQAGLDFAVIPSRINEKSVPFTTPAAHVRELARLKALDVAHRYPDSWVIGADTIVIIDGQMMGKPSGRDEARRMLTRLGGATHLVYTGFCIRHQNRDRLILDAVATEVRFKALSAEEIEWYIHTSEPFDKAGAYAIQGLGTFLVRSINGSYTNVVGLPVCEVIEALIREKAVGLDMGGGIRHGNGPENKTENKTENGTENGRGNERENPS